MNLDVNGKKEGSLVEPWGLVYFSCPYGLDKSTDIFRCAGLGRVCFNYGHPCLPAAVHSHFTVKHVELKALAFNSWVDTDPHTHTLTHTHTHPHTHIHAHTHTHTHTLTHSHTHTGRSSAAPASTLMMSNPDH